MAHRIFSGTCAEDRFRSYAQVTRWGEDDSSFVVWLCRDGRFTRHASGNAKTLGEVVATATEKLGEATAIREREELEARLQGLRDALRWVVI